MIGLFDAGFLHILMDDRARVPKGIDRAQERIDHLVETMTRRRDKVVIPAPALAEFMLLASDRWVDYLTIIRRKSVFEIAGFDDPEAIELVDHWLKCGDGKRLRQNSPATWAKLKYDRQIAAIAVTRRAETIYSADEDLRKLAAQLELKCIGLDDLPMPPPEQMTLEEANNERPEVQALKPEPPRLLGSGDRPPEGQAGAEGEGERQDRAQAEDTEAV